MNFESVGSNSDSPFQGQSPNRANTNLASKIQGRCFHCKKQGHWFRDCPEKSPKKPEPSSGSRDLPKLQCPCGSGICIVRISTTKKNPVRKFYSCPGNSGSKCEFFKWCDTVMSDEISDLPVCACGAGICRMSTETSGPNAGRKFFVCPIKRGQGACNFFQWQDTQSMKTSNTLVNESVGSPQSTLITSGDTSPLSNNLVQVGDSCNQGMGVESPVAYTLEQSQKLKAFSALSRKDRVRLGEFNEQDRSDELALDEPSRKHHKLPRNEALKIDGSACDFTTQCLDMPQAKSVDTISEKRSQASVLISEADIHRRQPGFWRQISIVGATFPGASFMHSYFWSSTLPMTSVQLKQDFLVTDAIHQILVLHGQGWWGRLAFPPARCLAVPTPEPFVCCILDVEASTTIAQGTSDAERPKTNKLSLHTLCLDAEPLDVGLWEPSGVKSSPKIAPANIITESILEAFQQAAVRIEIALITLLKSMDFRDHESMVREANSTFAALECLSIDYQPFREQVKEFIYCAALLGAIEMCICSSEEIVEQYKLKKLQLDNISRLHAEATDALKASNERLQLLREKACHVKDLLIQIETEMSCCQAENVDLGARIAQISEDMFESKKSLDFASKEVEANLEVSEEREVKREAAKVALEKARSQLQPYYSLSSPNVNS
ncbi:hypothetical protein F0562_004758 [Nyssa sinensis]|uniref:Uncharacterized protein n=1 Tax=Nyssa sinensis TaxID=561372 RepID=A0A5J5AIK7_9ASTE|nr:hypothetical protein F0562_004758 [Nyssa sinensis]